ncbi:MAG TPA: glycosyltransferase family 39 protein [Thermodesulfobacteriota bacterium]|nr:glycosyltransferase family 39 protein [Thermodesulfobacteriota bacterium]
MNVTKKKEVFIVVLCLLLGFALRFYALEKKSLWVDEVHTFNDSRDDLTGQIKYYKENPTFLHPPMFFVLTHLFHPFEKPERDLRIIPLIAGVLSIPMIYFLSSQFSPVIALPCTLSLTFMTYHISLSQEGRSYTLIMFLGMVGLYFFMKYLKTSKMVLLLPAGFFLSTLFYISYSSLSFIFLSQTLWLYQTDKNNKRKKISSFLLLTGIILLVCLPWILFVIFNFKAQPLMEPYQEKLVRSLWEVLYWMLHDWTVHLPLMIISIILLALLLIGSELKRNAGALLLMIFLPVTGIYLLCHFFKINHFISSRYFINFLPIFLISLYLSVNNIELRFQRLKNLISLRLLFSLFFIASNLVILPFYYQSDKMNLRGLVNYLQGELREGDKIFDTAKGMGLMAGILHYFGTVPAGRDYVYSVNMISKNETEFTKSFTYQGKQFSIYNASSCCNQYIEDGSRLWIIADKFAAQKLKDIPAFVLKGFFDGSFLNLDKFPYDASLYLFLIDPKSLDEKGIDLPSEVLK